MPQDASLNFNSSFGDIGQTFFDSAEWKSWGACMRPKNSPVWPENRKIRAQLQRLSYISTKTERARLQIMFNNPRGWFQDSSGNMISEEVKAKAILDDAYAIMDLEIRAREAMASYDARKD